MYSANLINFVASGDNVQLYMYLHQRRQHLCNRWMRCPETMSNMAENCRLRNAKKNRYNLQMAQLLSAFTDWIINRINRFHHLTWHAEYISIFVAVIGPMSSSTVANCKSARVWNKIKIKRWESPVKVLFSNILGALHLPGSLFANLCVLPLVFVHFSRRIFACLCLQTLG